MRGNISSPKNILHRPWSMSDPTWLFIHQSGEWAEAGRDLAPKRISLLISWMLPDFSLKLYIDGFWFWHYVQYSVHYYALLYAVCACTTLQIIFGERRENVKCVDSKRKEKANFELPLLTQQLNFSQEKQTTVIIENVIQILVIQHSIYTAFSKLLSLSTRNFCIII